MSKRLEEIKKALSRAEHKRESLQMTDMVNILENLMIQNDLSWIIEQAEQVEELLSIVRRKETYVHLLQRQNKRYREAIEQSLTEGEFEDVPTQLERIVTTLSKALEGDPHD